MNNCFLSGHNLQQFRNISIFKSIILIKHRRNCSLSQIFVFLAGNFFRNEEMNFSVSSKLVQGESRTVDNRFSIIRPETQTMETLCWWYTGTSSKRGNVEEWFEHLNNMDPTGSIKFTHEEETDSSIPFLDTLLHRRQDGSVNAICL